MYRILLVTFFFTLVLADPPGLKICNSTIGSVIKVEIMGSDYKDEKYILKSGTDVGIDVTLITTKDIQKPEAFVEIELNGSNLTFPLLNLDGCKILKCPLPKGGPYVYKAKLPVLTFYPKVETVATLLLKNEDGEVIACIEVPGKIV